jgi:hypothetical protein
VSLQGEQVFERSVKTFQVRPFLFASRNERELGTVGLEADGCWMARNSPATRRI